MITDRRTLLGAMASVSSSFAISPQTASLSPVILHVGDSLPRFGLLKPGSHSYLISRIEGDRHIAQNIWRREVKFENVDGARRLRIFQHWDGVGPTPGSVIRESLFEVRTFRPLTHTRITTANQIRTVEGFQFGQRGITGLPGLANNTQADFSVPSTEPMYNFETDMEMLQTLPWSDGYAVSIPFFHPGPGSVAARYLWYVDREEALTGPNGGPIPCWVVACDYNTGKRPTLFWFAKGTQLMIKMEGPAGEESVRRKTLLF